MRFVETKDKKKTNKRKTQKTVSMWVINFLCAWSVLIWRCISWRTSQIDVASVDRYVLIRWLLSYMRYTLAYNLTVYTPKIETAIIIKFIFCFVSFPFSFDFDSHFRKLSNCSFQFRFVCSDNCLFAFFILVAAVGCFFSFIFHFNSLAFGQEMYSKNEWNETKKEQNRFELTILCTFKIAYFIFYHK